MEVDLEENNSDSEMDLKGKKRLSSPSKSVQELALTHPSNGFYQEEDFSTLTSERDFKSIKDRKSIFPSCLRF